MQRPIPVYAAERRDGLTEIIQANASVSYLAPLKGFTPDEQTRAIALASTKKPIDDVTLIYFEDILATTGWNLNSDVFTHEELWAARHTIDHKPINMEHNYLQIMGHVVSSHAIDADFKVVAEDSAIDELPEKFHVKNESVLYRTIGDEDRDEFMANLEQEILAGEYFVSMESFFNGFDYGILGEDGSKAILPRNNATAFLTKHMRQYGGSGVYQEATSGKKYTLGRVMKNIHFKGKGVVKRPGNPESVIFSQVDSFKATYAPTGYFNNDRSVDAADANIQEIIMPEPVIDNTDLANALETIKTLKAEISTLAAKDFEKQIAGLENDKLTLASKVTSLETQVEAFTENITKLNSDLEAAKTELDSKTTALAAIEAEKAIASRTAAILAKGVDASLATSLVEKFTALTQADFDATIEVLAKSWKPAASKVETEKQLITNASVEETPPLLTGDSNDKESTKAELIEFYNRNKQAVPAS